MKLEEVFFFFKETLSWDFMVVCVGRWLVHNYIKYCDYCFFFNCVLHVPDKNGLLCKDFL